MTSAKPVVFALEPHVLFNTLCQKLSAIAGQTDARLFPDGESYLRIETPVTNQHCIILADLSRLIRSGGVKSGVSQKPRGNAIN